VFTFIVEPRRKPTRVMPASAASSSARLEGADTAAHHRDSRHEGDVGATCDQPLPDQEPGRQLEVVARSAHGDVQRLTADPDLHGFFDGEGVEPHRTTARLQPHHPAFVNPRDPWLAPYPSRSPTTSPGA